MALSSTTAKDPKSRTEYITLWRDTLAKLRSTKTLRRYERLRYYCNEELLSSVATTTTTAAVSFVFGVSLRLALSGLVR